MKETRICSPDNPTFKSFLKLTRAHGIKKGGMALLSGPKQTREVLRDFPEKCAGIISCTAFKQVPLEPEAMFPSFVLSPGLFRQIDLFNTGKPLLLVKVQTLPDYSFMMETEGCTLLIPFQDPANVGAVIRTAAAFSVTRVVMMKEAAHPFHPRAMRAAGSNLFRIPLFSGPELGRIERMGGQIITLSPQGQDVGDFQFPPSFCLVPGLEGPGLPESLRNAISICVPMRKGVESLNAAMATGIALYMWRKGIQTGEKCRI
jgi:tRNA(Leu) C34 or U34 (ribose-2'-O)-methylase TrmL